MSNICSRVGSAVDVVKRGVLSLIGGKTSPKPQVTFPITTINIARDFSKFPEGRLLSDGEHSAEAFRDNILAPAIAGGGMVVVELDGGLGYGSSFLEEAFGGLVTKHGLDCQNLELVSKDESLVLLIGKYIAEASEARASRLSC